LKRDIVQNILHADLQPHDWIIICGCLIRVRDLDFELAEAAREDGNVERAGSFEGFGQRINAILLKMRHPAAIETMESEVRSGGPEVDRLALEDR
jgi:hypothetical protein